MNSEEACRKAISSITSFLRPRGLELNINKTKTKKLLEKENLNFVGFQFSIVKKKGRNIIYNYPPPQKVKNLKEKINKTLLKYRRQPYLAFFNLNLVIRGWCNFYSSGNSKKIFQDINYWLWHKIYRYLWHNHKQEFKISSQRIFKRKLSLFIWNTYHLPNPNWNSGRWWGIPVARLHRRSRQKAIAGNNKPYYLCHPSSHNVSTPSIKLGLRAYYPPDRIELEGKAMGWKSGIQAEIIAKSKGKCALCSCSLLDDETNVELHHVQPIQYDGPRTRLNLKALCTECHKLVSGAVKTKDFESIKNFEQCGILKNVSRTLEHT